MGKSSRIYEKIDKTAVDVILKALADHGAVVSGTGPWNVDTRNHGVKLLGEWDGDASKLCITVTDSDWYVPQSKIWENIDSLMTAAVKKQMR